MKKSLTRQRDSGTNRSMKGSELHQVLKKLKMTHKEFSEYCGVSAAAVTRWVNDQRKMHPVMEKHVRQTAEELLRKAS